MKQKAVIIGL